MNDKQLHNTVDVVNLLSQKEWVVQKPRLIIIQFAKKINCLKNCNTIEEWQIIYSNENIVVWGDFIMVPDEKEHRFPTKYNSHNFNQIITDFSCPLNLINIWRKLNQDKNIILGASLNALKAQNQTIA